MKVVFAALFALFATSTTITVDGFSLSQHQHESNPSDRFNTGVDSRRDFLAKVVATTAAVASAGSTASVKKEHDLFVYPNNSGVEAADCKETTLASWNFKPKDRWNEMYDRLNEFVVNHGHAIVPMKYEEDMQLSQWVYEQRRLFAKGRLPRERKQRLDDLGDWRWSLAVKN